MALTSALVEPQNPKDHSSTPAYTYTAAGLMSLLLAIYAAKKSRKELKRLKRKLALTYLKYSLQQKFNKIRSFFSKKPLEISDRTLLFILLGLIVIILIFIEPLVSIAV